MFTMENIFKNIIHEEELTENIKEYICMIVIDVTDVNALNIQQDPQYFILYLPQFIYLFFSSSFHNALKLKKLEKVSMYV